MTGEQDFEPLNRLKEISTLAPALALLVGGLTSSVWLGYRFLNDRRWNRRTPPAPRVDVPPPAEADEVPRLAPGVSSIAHAGATALLAEPTAQRSAPASYAGVALASPTTTAQRADDTPNPARPRAADALRAARTPAHRKKQVERRANVRRSGMTVPVRVTAGGLRLEEIDGTVVDRSQGGLCLEVPAPLEVGQIFRLRSLLYDDMTPWVEVEARAVRPHGGRWLVGCRFASPLPWNMLLLFG